MEGMGVKGRVGLGWGILKTRKQEKTSIHGQIKISVNIRIDFASKHGKGGGVGRGGFVGDGEVAKLLLESLTELGVVAAGMGRDEDGLELGGHSVTEDGLDEGAEGLEMDPGLEGLLEPVLAEDDEVLLAFLALGLEGL